MTSTVSRGGAVSGSGTVSELAGRLRIAAGRLAREASAQSRLDGMTPSRLAALSALDVSGPMRVGELAERVSITAPTTTRLVDCLCERGLVERTADPADHRATLISLSAEGRAGLHSVRELGTGLLAERITGLTTEDLTVLAAALPVLEKLSLT